MLKEIKHIAIVCNPKAGNGNAMKLMDKIVGKLQNKVIEYTTFIYDGRKI